MKLNIPTKLEEVTLATYIKWEISDKTDDDMIRVFCGVDPKLIPKKTRDEVVNTLTLMLYQDVQFKKVFTYNGVKFGFIPKLDDISGGEYIDLVGNDVIKGYMSDTAQWGKAMAVLFRPVTRIKRNWFKRNADPLYDILPYSGADNWEKVMLKTPCVYFLGAMVFFYDLTNELKNYTLDYLMQAMREAQPKVDLTENGGGMLVSEL